jgi:hypothetical protein
VVEIALTNDDRAGHRSRAGGGALGRCHDEHWVKVGITDPPQGWVRSTVTAASSCLRPRW